MDVVVYDLVNKRAPETLSNTVDTLGRNWGATPRAQFGTIVTAYTADRAALLDTLNTGVYCAANVLSHPTSGYVNLGTFLSSEVSGTSVKLGTFTPLMSGAITIRCSVKASTAATYSVGIRCLNVGDNANGGFLARTFTGSVSTSYASKTLTGFPVVAGFTYEVTLDSTATSGKPTMYCNSAYIQGQKGTTTDGVIPNV